MTDDFQRALEMDPLLEAEKLTNASYKDDPMTEALGFVFMQAKDKYITDEMLVRDDTFRNCSFDYALRIFTELGFEVVYTDNFVDTRYDRHNEDTLLILWRKDGILARLESYPGYPDKNVKQVNSCTIFSNWLPNDPQDKTQYRVTSSGHYSRLTPGYDGTLPEDPWTWIGDWDARVGIRNTLNRLEAVGTFLPVWLEQPTLSLNNYAHVRDWDMRGDDWHERWTAETEERIALLPSYVQDAIRGVKSRHG